MAWRDDLRAGKFRDADFHIESHDASGGRRLAVHEYPLRDTPYPEDMGRATRKWAVTAYVLGADYMPARDALVAALEAYGPGTLVHPYLGTLRVAVADFQCSESTREGGLARFSINFVEAVDPTRPDVLPDTSAAVESRAVAAQDAAEIDFDTGFSLAGPGWVLDAAGSVIDGAVGAIESVLGLDSNRVALAAQWLDVPAMIAGQLYGAVARVQSLFTAPADRFAGLRQLFGFGASKRYAIPRTPSRARVQSNERAVATLVRQAAVIEAARASADMAFASYDDALAVRDELAEALDEVALTASDATYAAITDLRVAVVADIGARGADLARLLRVTPAETLPALVLAHQIHGNARRAADLVARNRVRHPGAVPGGQVLEVLGNA